MARITFFLLCISGMAFAQSPREITVEDIYKKDLFGTETVKGLRSMQDGKTYVSIERDPQTGERYVARNNYRDGQVAERLFSERELQYEGKQLELSTEFGPNERQVVIAHEKEAIYRRSSKAYFYIFDLESRKVTPVSKKPGKQQYATLSPNGELVAFVRNNNLFYTDLKTGEETQVTHDGAYNHIINGSTDWVYEEEFAFAPAFFWNADGSKLAYYRFDESEVREFEMSLFEQLYPQTYKFKYPKPGEKNSEVGIHIYDLKDGQSLAVDLGPEKDQYIPRIKWTQDPDLLCILRMNRHQNTLEYLFAHASDAQVEVRHKETDPYYIDINDDLTFLKDGKHFILSSEQDGFNHIYLYDMQGKLVQQITQGDWEVTNMYGIDEETKTLYYQSTESSPLLRDIYSISLNGKNKRKLSTKEGTNNATFSSDFSYYVLNHSSVHTPPFISLHETGGKQIRVLEDNAKAAEVAKAYGIQAREFFQMTTSESVMLNGYMIKPTDFDPNKQYPVLMFVYGGPGSQQVANSWSHNVWFDLLAQKGYLIVCVDNRGTGFRGAEFKKMTYMNLGKYEIADQIEVAKWLGQQSYVDSTRIGLWGWSFGGYMASLAITKGADVFKSTIAVAPVTSWRYYDTIYTERYLRTPQENPKGYDENSPINFADRLKGNFLLIHGTADDNVHFQNSVMFSEALIQANKPFEQAYYPNKNHSIRGGNTSLHLYTKMTNFILNNL